MTVERWVLLKAKLGAFFGRKFRDCSYLVSLGFLLRHKPPVLRLYHIGSQGTVWPRPQQLPGALRSTVLLHGRLGHLDQEAVGWLMGWRHAQPLTCLSMAECYLNYARHPVFATSALIPDYHITGKSQQTMEKCTCDSLHCAAKYSCFV